MKERKKYMLQDRIADMYRSGARIKEISIVTDINVGTLYSIIHRNFRHLKEEREMSKKEKALELFNFYENNQISSRELSEKLEMDINAVYTMMSRIRRKA